MIMILYRFNKNIKCKTFIRKWKRLRNDEVYPEVSLSMCNKMCNEVNPITLRILSF